MTTENQAPEGGPDLAAAPLPALPPHPDARVFTWTSRELAAIKRYGEECAAAALDCLNVALSHWTDSDGQLDLPTLVGDAFAALSPHRPDPGL